MTTKVLEALGFLVRRYTNQRVAGLDDRSTVEVLQARGLDLHEIGQAFAAMLGEAQGSDASDQCAVTEPPSARVLNPSERVKFDLEAQGLIHVISASGTVTATDMEMAITAAMAMEQPEVGSLEFLSLIRDALGDSAHSALWLDQPDSPAVASGHGVAH